MPWFAGGDEIVKDLVRDIFVKDAFVTKTDQVVLQSLQLDTAIVGYIGNADFTKVWESSLGTHRRKLGTADRDFVIAVGFRIGKGFKGRERHPEILAAAIRTTAVSSQLQ